MCIFKKNKKANASKKVDEHANLEMIDGVNNAVADAIKTVKILAEEYDLLHIPDIDEMTIFMHSCYRIDPIYNYKYSTEYVKEMTDTRRVDVQKYLNKCIERIEYMRDHVEENTNEIERLRKNGMPLFIDVIDGYYNTYKYCFCYEFKETDKKGVYDAYVVESDNKPRRRKIYAATHMVKPMTETEFENKYIIGRLAEYSPINEIDVVEYDNQLRQYFHGQREITD